MSENDVPTSQTPSMAQDSARQEPEVPEFKVSAINSGSSTWAEEMELNWTKVITRDNLLGLKNFFKQGMDIAVVEEKVHS